MGLSGLEFWAKRPRSIRRETLKRGDLAVPVRLVSQPTIEHAQPEQVAGASGFADTEVTWEDQQNINKFGRLNNRFHDLEDEIKLAKEMNENLEDAGNELILADEETIRFQIGEVFVHLSNEQVETRIEKMKEETSKNLEKLEEEKASILAQMAELKKILYGKFKDSINLEED